MKPVEYKDIFYEVKDSVARITINRPKVLNALNGHTIKELDHAICAASLDHSVGVVVLTGVGERSFCSGGDVKWEAEGGLVDLNFRLNRLVLLCPKPVIARVNGYAIGSGNHLAYFCDFTIAADHAIFGQTGPRVGSPAAGHYVTHLPNIIGHKRAREMWMLTRQYPAKKMLEWGLVNAVVPYAELDAEVDRWCKELLEKSPTCLKILKYSFNESIDLTAMDDVIAKVAPDYYSTGEQLEGANAFLEKRKPDFSPWRK